jgi:two-component system sensor histidine kinase KdpD
MWDVDDLLAHAVSDITSAERIHVGEMDDLPPVAVDAAHIQRVLVNLLENALKYSVADVDVLARPDGGGVLLEVLDAGGATPAPGLGLGLAVARGFAEANGATLELLPRDGGGTCARLVLKVAP